MAANSTRQTATAANVDVYGPRNRLLALLALWTLWVMTFGPTIDFIANYPWYASAVPGLLVALAMGYVVGLDYRQLQAAGIAWGTGRWVVAAATALLPPYVLLYLWKRGKELLD